MAHKLFVGSLSFSTSSEGLHQLDGRQLKVHLDKLVDAGGGPRRTGTSGGRW